MIPLPLIGTELILGLGAAFFLGNLWALLRPWFMKRFRGQVVPRPPSRGRIMLNVLIGAVVATWGLATLLAR